MVRIDSVRRLKATPVTLALSVLISCAGSAAFAQGMMRGPNINMGARAPAFDRGVGVSAITRVDPAIGARVLNGIATDGTRTRTDCSAAVREANNGNCYRQPITSDDRDRRKGKGGRDSTPTDTLLTSRVPNEIVAELDGALTEAQADALARRHGLRRVESQNFSLIGATIGLFRLTGGKTYEAARREFAAENGVRTVQANFRYVLQDQKTGLSEGDPAQYALAKLRLPEAHTLAHGTNITIAVIDSGIDLKHREFSGSTITPYDALGSQEGAHVHGTGVAGAIVAHARLMGSAPGAQILAIRAFGASGKGAESTSYTILKGFDFAASHGAQIINMSFAGPKDALITRGLSALAAKNIVLIAAAGNEGAKSPPLYPAADPNVMAVSATDAKDRLFPASNRGAHIAVAAPGADIFLPAPGDAYQMKSGTSFSAAYVSGLAALVLERNPSLKPNEVRAILTKTARDLGPPGPDEQFGAGEVDAFAAVSAATAPSTPVAAVSDKPVVADSPASETSRAISVAPAPADNAAVVTTTAEKAAEGGNPGAGEPAQPGPAAEALKNP